MFSKVATERHGPAASLFWSFAFATLAFAVAAPPWRPFLAAPEHAIALIALGVVPTLVPYALYLRGLQELRASTAAMLASVEPVVAATLAALLLGERLTVVQGIGMVLVVAAAVLVSAGAAGESATAPAARPGRS
jgi:drug/metabolite transporter, DME family